MCSHIESSAAATRVDRENAGDEECIRNLPRKPARSERDNEGLESECIERPAPRESNIQLIRRRANRPTFFVRDGAAHELHGDDEDDGNEAECNGHSSAFWIQNFRPPLQNSVNNRQLRFQVTGIPKNQTSFSIVVNALQIDLYCNTFDNKRPYFYFFLKTKVLKSCNLW